MMATSTTMQDIPAKMAWLVLLRLHTTSPHVARAHHMQKNESDEIYQLRTTQVLEWKTMDPLPLGGVTWLVSTTWEDIGRGCHDLQLRCIVNEMIPGWMREDIRGSNGITMLTSVVMKDS
jgi:hypothetical protein